MTDDTLDPAGFYDFAGYASTTGPDPGPKQRDRIREQAQRIAVEQAVKRCGPITEDSNHATTQTPAPVATDRGAEGSETV